MVARQIRVSGRVQGVGYRVSLQDEAQKHDISGWVRNRSDGRVEALLQGSPEAVEALIAWARRGPPGARVSDVAVASATEDSALRGFELRPTL
jgi:acylphosphatase